MGWSLGDSGRCGLGDTLRLATNTPACISIHVHHMMSVHGLEHQYMGINTGTWGRWRHSKMLRFVETSVVHRVNDSSKFDSIR